MLKVIIVSEDPYNKFSDINAAQNALLSSRTGIGDYGSTSPRTGISVIAPITPRTGIGVIAPITQRTVNNELLQQRINIGVTAPITPRTGIGVPPRTAGSSISSPMAVSAYAGLYAFSPAYLDNDYDSSSDSPAPLAFWTTRASATFIIGRVPL